MEQSSHVDYIEESGHTRSKVKLYENVGKMMALLSLNMTDCEEDPEENLELMVKSCYLHL